MKYRAEIDGLRALAVVPVILFHAGFKLFSGGYVGVDVFFVVSGYLITTILIENIENSQFSLANFYERRARRILPALFFVMLVCIPFAWMWMLPDPLENFGQSLVATVFFANNILLLITSGYWDLASEFKPLLHTWSLGVEEQYYIIFPVLLWVVMRYAKKYLLSFIIILSLASLVASEVMWRDYPNENFYLILTRAWELFFGSIAAIYVLRHGVRGNDALSLLGLSLVLLSIFAYDEATPFPSVYSLVPVIGVILLVMYSEKNTLTGKLLSTRGLVGIGLISYSAYLWHLPLLAFAKIYSKNEPTQQLNTVLILATFVMAYLSWRFIEQPFRKNEVIGRSVFYPSVLIFASVLVVFGYSAHKTHGFVDRVFDSASKPEEMYISYNKRNYEFKRDAFDSTKKMNLLVIGNSFGRDIVNVLRETYDLRELSLIYRDDFNDCSLAENRIGSALFSRADIVIFVTQHSLDKPWCAESVLELAKTQKNTVFFIGTKQFGYNLNWVARVKPDERGLLRNEIIQELNEAEKLAKASIPAEHYISIVDAISDEQGILITDEFGRLISGDSMHLTKYGAIYVGKKVFMPSRLSKYLAISFANL